MEWTRWKHVSSRLPPGLRRNQGWGLWVDTLQCTNQHKYVDCMLTWSWFSSIGPLPLFSVLFSVFASSVRSHELAGVTASELILSHPCFVLSTRDGWWGLPPPLLRDCMLLLLFKTRWGLHSIIRVVLRGHLEGACFVVIVVLYFGLYWWQIALGLLSLVQDHFKLPGDNGEGPISKCSSWLFGFPCEIFSLLENKNIFKMLRDWMSPIHKFWYFMWKVILSTI